MEGDAKYMAPELMRGNFGKPADVFRWVALMCIFSCTCMCTKYSVLVCSTYLDDRCNQMRLCHTIIMYKFLEVGGHSIDSTRILSPL